MIKFVGCVQVKVVNIFSVIYWTISNRLKTLLIWTVGKGFVSEGRLYISSVKGFVSIGSNVKFGPSVRVGASAGAEIIIGNNVTINQGSFILSMDSITIGDNTLVGEYVSIRDNDHAFDDLYTPIRNQGYTKKKVVIGEDVWLGRGVVVNKGVTIGEGAVVGANSVVTKNVLPFTVVAGVPAKKISDREN